LSEKQKAELIANKVKVGNGSYGDVFKVTINNHRCLKGTYALKRIDINKTREINLKAEIENQKATCLKSQFICNLYYAWKSDVYQYLLLDWADGGDLGTLVKATKSTGGMSQPDFKFYAYSIIKAFNTLHNENVCHRDLKPHNVVMDKDGYVKIVDLGLSKRIEPEPEEGRLRANTYCGTSEYRSPEVHAADDKCSYDAVKADYFAIGITLYELFIGHAAFLYHNSKNREWETWSAQADKTKLFHIKYPKEDNSKKKWDTLDSSLQEFLYSLLEKKEDDRKLGDDMEWFVEYEKTYGEAIAKRQKIAPYKPKFATIDKERMFIGYEHSDNKGSRILTKPIELIDGQPRTSARAQMKSDIFRKWGNYNENGKGHGRHKRSLVVLPQEMSY